MDYLCEHRDGGICEECYLKMHSLSMAKLAARITELNIELDNLADEDGC